MMEASVFGFVEEPDEYMDEEDAAAMVLAREVLERGETQTETRRRVMAQRELLLKAEGLFTAALRKAPTIDPRLYGRLARVNGLLHAHESCLEFASKALVAFPRSAMLHFWRGRSLFSLGRFQEAFHSFTTALTVGRKRGRKIVDRRLLEKYRLAAYERHRPFVPYEDLLGDLEVEHPSPRQRDVDRNLNVYNLHESIPALTKTLPAPSVEPPSRLVLPIANRLQSQPPRTSSGSRIATPIVATTTQPAAGVDENDDDDDDDDGESTRPEDETVVVEEDADGQEDGSVLYEVEVETTTGQVLELTVMVGDNPGDIVEAFLARNTKVLSRRQAQQLRESLIPPEAPGEGEAA